MDEQTADGTVSQEGGSTEAQAEAMQGPVDSNRSNTGLCHHSIVHTDLVLNAFDTTVIDHLKAVGISTVRPQGLLPSIPLGGEFPEGARDSTHLGRA